MSKPIFLNLGILAHVDAGKTSLTERLLYDAGVIDEIGSVDAGSTQTDSLALERRRGITIRSAVVSFALGDRTVNLIDTPGHPDFIAEVERVLGVLDGAVLVVSAVEGVQAQTRVLLHTLRRLRIPTLLFVNKIDRAGARHGTLLDEIARRLSPAVVPMGVPRRLGTRDADCTPFDPAEPAFTARLSEVLAEHDDALLAAYVDEEPGRLGPDRLRAALAAQTGRALVHPLFFGSAITGAGVDQLAGGIQALLPAATGAPDGEPAGTVFKIERGPGGEKFAYVRMRAGTVSVRDTVCFGAGREAKVTGVAVFERGGTARRGSVSAGQIGLLSGLAAVRIGDAVGDPGPVGAAERYFPPPSLETVVAPAHPADRGALHAALTELAEQDPLINLRRDELRQEIHVSLYGEVQKEVIQATLAEEFGIEVVPHPTTTLHVERLAGVGEAAEFKGKDDNPFLATVGLRVEPAPDGAGVTFRLGVELGSMPYAFFRAVEDTVRETLAQGPHGWPIPDCVVTMTHSGYAPRQSHAHAIFDKSMSSTGADFRQLTPLVLMTALRRAGTVVHEPLHRFRIEAPEASPGVLLPVLARLDAVPHTTANSGDLVVIEGDIPAARVHDLEQRLPTLTSGEGLLEAAFHHYRPVRGPAPERPRTDANPLNRKEYLLRVVRRVPGGGGATSTGVDERHR
ncbi:TetM/TetW/TetO/TetS family tetracycline resistance ribosomal protection protein [Streptomyces sp. 8K308]|uniref:elongation factor G n=1 Tax=Streptomyces sp. 8K308 TaxID=2530388 RepID=UPI00105279F8|nr:TetM/TetW/TetO/TetS family tetracycline resistance ribosomal protection protein [Streptomyces sp. 8K308]TDC24234.1 TetM/TetW/TetO/TetS family tetracycline resistance ribosomal protection protein [Streptomyces sp. 8K308]